MKSHELVERINNGEIKDGTEFIGNGINAGTQWQATLKGGLKTLFSLIFGK